jgi:hypothetical protein
MTPVRLRHRDRAHRLGRARQVPAELSTRSPRLVHPATARADRRRLCPHHLQRVVAIACALRDGAGFKIASVGNPEDSEPELIAASSISSTSSRRSSSRGMVVASISRCQPARADSRRDGGTLLIGDDDREFKFNSYLARYHTRHLDLMDVPRCTSRGHPPGSMRWRDVDFPASSGWTAAK